MRTAIIIAVALLAAVIAVIISEPATKVRIARLCNEGVCETYHAPRSWTERVFGEAPIVNGRRCNNKDHICTVEVLYDHAGGNDLRQSDPEKRLVAWWLPAPYGFVLKPREEVYHERHYYTYVPIYSRRGKHSYDAYRRDED